MKLLKVTLIVFCLVLISNSPVHADCSSYYDKFRTDMDETKSEYSRATEITKDIMDSRKKNKIAELYKILSQTERKITEYKLLENKIRLDCDDMYISALRTRGFITECTANMRFLIATAHKWVGEFQKARDMYRSIVINYTGDAYRSNVREAEYALEDLKDFEKEWKAERKKKGNTSK